MAAGDILLDANGNIMLDADGNIMLSDGAGDDCCCAPICPALTFNSTVCTNKPTPTFMHPPDAFEASWSLGAVCHGTCFVVDITGAGLWAKFTALPSSGTLCLPIVSAVAGTVIHRGSVDATYGALYSDSGCTTFVRNFTRIVVELKHQTNQVSLTIKAQTSNANAVVRLLEHKVTGLADPQDCYASQSFTNDLSACENSPTAVVTDIGGDRAIVATGGSASVVACAC
jgi:hypothetical protein